MIIDFAFNWTNTKENLHTFENTMRNRGQKRAKLARSSQSPPHI